MQYSNPYPVSPSVGDFTYAYTETEHPSPPEYYSPTSYHSEDTSSYAYSSLADTERPAPGADIYDREYSQVAQDQHFPSQGAYYDQPEVQSPEISVPGNYYASDVPLHAPVPLPGYPAVLYSDAQYNYEYPIASYSSPTPSASPVSPIESQEVDLNSICQPQLDFVYPSPSTLAQPLRQKFPTPSELLTELAAKDTAATHVSTVPILEKKSETARRARQKAMAKSVGFEPTDPDSISSHDKKRHYLECLEHYVMYLHEQLSLVGAGPLALERVSTYRGLSSRSIRTLLVHMQNTAKKLNVSREHEEQLFISLRDQVLQQDAAAVAAAQEYRRNSIVSSVSEGDSSGSYTV